MGGLDNMKPSQPHTTHSNKSSFLSLQKAKKQKQPSFSLMTKFKLQKQTRGSVAGVWQKISTPSCFETLRNAKFDRGQLIIIREKIFLITSAAFAESFLGSLPEAVSVGFSTTNARSKCISFDDALVTPFDLHGSVIARYATPYVRGPLTVENFYFSSWLIGLKHGFNVVFESVVPRKKRSHQHQETNDDVEETADDGDSTNPNENIPVALSGLKTKPKSQNLNRLSLNRGGSSKQKLSLMSKKDPRYSDNTRAPIKTPSPAPPIPSQVYVEYATYLTLQEVTDERLYEPEDRPIMNSLFANIGTISVGPEVPKSCLELIQGEEFDEAADVYLLSDRDVHVYPLGPMWQGDASAGAPYRQTLLVALCNMFLQQSKSRVSNVLAHNLNRTIDPADIKFKERVTSAEQISCLSGTHKSVKGLERSINRILANSTAGTRKLKMGLTGVEFSEHQSGPIVSFDSGVLKCPIFKKGSKIDQRAFDRAFLFAVDEEGGREMMNKYGLGVPNEEREVELAMGFEDLFSVTSSERRVHQSKKENVLEKQRIAKHQSGDVNVIEKAVKRLFTGVEIGRTSDIVDSLDLGANVNSLNDHNETPLVVAAKSRNYTIIDLLLTRGAAPNTADAHGVSPLHYESGQGDVEAVKLMLSYGADPNAEDFMGRTPLHYAVVGSHLDTVDLLVFCGADSSIVNKEGDSPKLLAPNREIRAALLETDLIIKGIKTGNVSIEHLTLQADVVYRLADTRLVIRTPSGMGLAKTSLMVRRVVPEYSYYGPQPHDKELLLSDIYDFRISGAYVEEPLMLQIPVYSRAEQYEDVFVKTDKGIYSTPVRIARMVDANKIPHWVCHARVCLYGIRSISLVARPRLERFLVSEVGGDIRSVLDPMVRLQFRQGAMSEETEVTFQVTAKPSYEEEDYDSILSMSHFFDIASTTMKPLNNDLLVSLPLPENYLGHGVLHVLMRKQGPDPEENSQEEWQELLRNPDYATDAVILRLSTWGQICLLERNPQYPVRQELGPGGEALHMVTSLHDKTCRREYSTCFLAMARPKPKAGPGVAEVVVECVLSSRVHARLHHWTLQSYVDLKPSHTMEFATIPKQAFVIKTAGRCQIEDLPLPPLQFHPKRNNCVHFTILPREVKNVEDGHVEIYIRRLGDTNVTHLSRESLQTLSHSKPPVDTASNAAMDAPKAPSSVSKGPQHHQSRDTLQLSRDQLLARIPLFLPWTAPPDDPRGQDSSEDLNVSPFDMDLPKTDIRGVDTQVLPQHTLPNRDNAQEQDKEHLQVSQPPQATVKQAGGIKAKAKTLPAEATKQPTQASNRSPAVAPASTVTNPANKKTTLNSKLQQRQKPQSQQEEKTTRESKSASIAGKSSGRSNETGLILRPGNAARPKSGKLDKVTSQRQGSAEKSDLVRPKSAPKSTATQSQTSSSSPTFPVKNSTVAREAAAAGVGKSPETTSATALSSATPTPSPASNNQSKTKPSSATQATRLGMNIRSVTPSSSFSHQPETANRANASRPTSAISGVYKVGQNEGVLDFLSRGLGEDWFRLGVLLGVPYDILQTWAVDNGLGLDQKAFQMLNHWRQTRRTRQDHGVPELLMTLQRIGKTQVVRALKDRLRTWIADNLEKRGFLKGFVNKNLLEETENLEPMSPLFLLSLVRRVGFSIDFVYDLGVSRPEVSRVITDPLLKHREDKMLGLLLVAKDKEPSSDVALRKIIKLLQLYNRTEALQWTLSACRNWLTNQGCADDRFAHGVRDLLLQHSATTHGDGSLAEQMPPGQQD